MENGLARKFVGNLPKQREFFFNLAHDKGFHPIQDPTKWVGVSYSDTVSYKGGRPLLHLYKNSVSTAICSLFPSIKDEVILLEQRKFFGELAQDMHFHPTNELDKWFSVSLDDVVSREGGWGIVNKYNGYRNAIFVCFPEISLDSLRFSTWKTSMERDFFDLIASERGFHPIRQCSEWYSISVDLVASKKGGANLLKMYNNNLRRALIVAYPAINLTSDKFQKWTPHKQRAFMDQLAHDKGFHATHDHKQWYDVTLQDFIVAGGRTLALKHKNHRKAIMASYPSLQLVYKNFVKWKDNTENQKEFFEELAKDKGFDPETQPQEWKNVSRDDITSRLGGSTLLSYKGSPARALLEVYPDLTPYSKLAPIAQKRDEKRLRGIVDELFSTYDKIYNAKKGVGIRFGATSEYQELDIWIPALKLGFEYQDKHHYISAWYADYPLLSYQQKDDHKRLSMKQKCLTLVIVPCWWDFKKESLAATIKIQRPELLQTYDNIGDAIPSTPPEDFFLVPTIPSIGEVMLAIHFRPGNEINQWWMGEKFDGTRTCWVATLNAMYTRSGVQLEWWDHVYKYIMPNCCLDGELWAGRGTYQELGHLFGTSVLHSAHVPAPMAPLEFSWSSLRYIVFDSPKPFNPVSFEIRYNILLLLGHSACIIIAPRINCMDVDYMHTYAQIIIGAGGEGVMLRKPLSAYENGRSASLVKYKASRDGEALVLRSQGIYCTCKLPTGAVFFATNLTSSRITKDDVVTYKCASVSSQGLPRKATILRKRVDLSWDDVL